MPINIHPTAMIDPKAQLGDGVAIGPYSIVGAHVTIGSEVTVGAYSIIDGFTFIDKGCRIFSHAVIGTEPQDLKFRGEDSYIQIGKNTIIREFVTIHPGTKGGGSKTKIGEQCYLMAYVHIAHDCTLGDHVIVSNAVNLAGHINIDSYANIGGLSGIHQFVRIGESALIGGCSAVAMDVPPYVIAAGNRARIATINTIGLERRGFSKESIALIKRAYKHILSSKLNITQALEYIEKDIEQTSEIQKIFNFIRSSERGICK